MTTYLMADSGAYFTLTVHDAEWCVAPLADFLGCAVRTETVAKAVHGYQSNVDWMVLAIPVKQHMAARAFLAGWQRGCRDGVDSVYGRQRSQTTTERVAEGSAQ